MHLSVAGLLICILCAAHVHGDVVKKDLRTAPLPGEQFVYFCADGPNSTGVVGFVQGDQSSGFQLEDWSLGGQKFGSSERQRAVQQAAVEACARSAFSGKTNMFVVEIDSAVYADVKNAFAQFRSDGRTEVTDLAIGLGQLLGIKLPTVLAKPFDYIKAIGMLNSGTYQNGGQWLWKPPTIKMVALPSSDPALQTDSHATSQAQMVPSASLDLIPTGLSTVKFVNRSALQHLYQALADAEDNPNVSYDIELEIADGVATNVFVHPVQMKRDSTLERGDSACVFTNLDSPAINYVELLDTLLLLGSTSAASVSKAWGFAPNHPLLGAPRNWQAAVTAPPACYLTAAKGPTLVALLSPTGGMKYASTLVRTVPHYPRDQVTSNAGAPLLLKNSVGSPDLTATEQAWLTYRSYINQTKAAAKIRSETFPNLSAAEIGKRRSYAKDAAEDDETSTSIRKYFGLREIGWHEFQANKYKQLQDDLIARHPQGQAVLYAVAQTNKNMLMLKTTDIGPSLVAQEAQYQALMTTSILSKQIVAEQFSPGMTPSGRVCDIVPARCADVFQQVEPEDNSLVEWQFGDKKQQKFANVLVIGTFSTASSVTLDKAFGSEPSDGKCATHPAPASALQIGVRTFDLSITNKTNQSRTLTLAYAGSFERAYWAGRPNSNYGATFQPNETKGLTVEFAPDAGYEDLNVIYLIEDGHLQAELTLDYSIISDPPMRTIEIDSGGVESGNGKDSGTYSIKVENPPSSHALRKACVWTSGDRTQCGESKYSTCDLTTLSDDAVDAVFTLEGHDENIGARNISVGHLKVTYQLTSQPTDLQ